MAFTFSHSCTACPVRPCYRKLRANSETKRGNNRAKPRGRRPPAVGNSDWSSFYGINDRKYSAGRGTLAPRGYQSLQEPRPNLGRKPALGAARLRQLPPPGSEPIGMGRARRRVNLHSAGRGSRVPAPRRERPYKWPLPLKSTRQFLHSRRQSHSRRTPVRARAPATKPEVARGCVWIR
jgi:hypothetical protein